MKCYVRWPDSDKYSGPYDVVTPMPSLARIEVEGHWITIPKSWTIGIDDGWKDWIPGQGQPEETRGKRGYWENESTEVNFDRLRWDLFASSHRYKVTGDAEPEPMPLSVIMDRSLWWKDDENGCWYFVDEYDPSDDVDTFHLTDSTWVSRDWFTGREHKRGEEFNDD
jgi:hypothetical protein